MTQPSPSPALSEADQALRETKALRDELMDYAQQLLRAETQAGFAGKDTAVRVKEPAFLAQLLTRAGSALQVRAWAAVEAERDKLRSDLAAAVILVGEHGRARGEAEGRLLASEMVGVVEGWRDRALKAEEERDKLKAQLHDSAMAHIARDLTDESNLDRLKAAEDSLREREAEIERLNGERDAMRDLFRKVVKDEILAGTLSLTTFNRCRAAIGTMPGWPFAQPSALAPTDPLPASDSEAGR